MRPGVVTVLCLVQFVDVLGVTSVVTAIPAILNGLGAYPAAAGPLATTYAMFFGAMLILGARLGDRYGHRRILLVGIVVFGVVSIIGGTAQALPQVLIARAVQGAAAAVSAPSALRLILHATAAGPGRSRALAAWSAVGAAAGATGFLIGGLLTTVLGWPSVFWVNAPVAALLFVGVVLVVREEPESESGRAERLDVLGAVLLVAAVMPVIAGTGLLEARATQPQGVGMILLGLAIAGLLAWRLRRARSPLVPRSAFRSTNLRRGSVQSFVNTATTSSSSVLATLVLQDRLGIPALLSGLVLMAFSLAVIGGSVATGRIAPRLGPDRLAAVGAATIACGNAVLAVLGHSWPWIVAVDRGRRRRDRPRPCSSFGGSDRLGYQRPSSLSRQRSRHREHRSAARNSDRDRRRHPHRNRVDPIGRMGIRRRNSTHLRRVVPPPPPVRRHKLTTGTDMSGHPSVNETTLVSPPRLPSVDEEHHEPDHCEDGANEGLRGIVMSGDVNDPSDDQDHAHHNGHPRENVSEGVRS